MRGQSPVPEARSSDGVRGGNRSSSRTERRAANPKERRGGGKSLVRSTEASATGGHRGGESPARSTKATTSEGRRGGSSPSRSTRTTTSGGGHQRGQSPARNTKTMASEGDRRGQSPTPSTGTTTSREGHRGSSPGAGEGRQDNRRSSVPEQGSSSGIRFKASDYEQARRHREKLCYICGDTEHWKVACPNRRSRPAGEEGARGHSSGQGEGHAGGKRPRSNLAKSGYTPVEKKSRTEAAKKPRYSFAEAASCSTTRLVVRNGDGTTPDFGALESIKLSLNKAVYGLVAKKEWAPTIQGWKSERDGIIVATTDSMSTHWVRAFLTNEHLQVILWDAYLAETRPKFYLSGFLRGAMADMGLEVARALVDYELKRIGLPGKVIVTSIKRTARGGIIWLKVDEDALVALGQRDFNLVVGAEGNVKFHDARKTAKAKEAETEIVDLEAKVQKRQEELAALRDELDRKVKERDDAALSAAAMSMEQQLSLDEGGGQAHSSGAAEDGYEMAVNESRQEDPGAEARSRGNAGDVVMEEPGGDGVTAEVSYSRCPKGTGKPLGGETEKE